MDQQGTIGAPLGANHDHRAETDQLKMGSEEMRKWQEACRGANEQVPAHLPLNGPIALKPDTGSNRYSGQADKACSATASRVARSKPALAWTAIP